MTFNQFTHSKMFTAKDAPTLAATDANKQWQKWKDEGADRRLCADLSFEQYAPYMVRVYARKGADQGNVSEVAYFADHDEAAKYWLSKCSSTSWDILDPTLWHFEMSECTGAWSYTRINH